MPKPPLNHPHAEGQARPPTPDLYQLLHRSLRPRAGSAAPSAADSINAALLRYDAGAPPSTSPRVASPQALPNAAHLYPVPLQRAHSLAWAVSFSLHGTMFAIAAWLIATSGAYGRNDPTAAGAAPTESPRGGDVSTTVELDAYFDDSSLRLPQVALKPHPSGAEPAPRPDAKRAGRGGERAVKRPALNLSDRDDDIDLSKDVASRVDRSQVQRLRVAPDRASRDDRRATIEPMELTFLASGSGTWNERRPLAPLDPSRGARVDAPPSPQGAYEGAPPRPADGPLPPSPPGNARLGNRQASTGVGLMHGDPGPRHRQSANVAFGRPRITKGRPAVPADDNDKPRDNVDSAQEVAADVQSLLHASTAGGQPAASGQGGEPGPEQPTGSGGPSGPGSRAAPLGQGQGPNVDLDGTDPRLSDYHRNLLAKIHPLWADAFPKWAALEGLQGLAVIQFTVWANGFVTGVQVLRPSGVPEFDENVRRAVLRAGPFAPLPANLNARSVNFKITFDSPNPAVR